MVESRAQYGGLLQQVAADPDGDESSEDCQLLPIIPETCRSAVSAHRVKPHDSKQQGADADAETLAESADPHQLQSIHPVNRSADGGEDEHLRAKEDEHEDGAWEQGQREDGDEQDRDRELPEPIAEGGEEVARIQVSPRFLLG